MGIAINYVQERYLETGRLFEVTCQDKVWKLRVFTVAKKVSILAK